MIPSTGKTINYQTGFFGSGQEQLFFRRSLPETPTAHLYLLHGYGDHSGRYDALFQWLGQRQIACHSFDFRGHGRSSGRRGFISNWDEYLDDFRSFLSFEAKQSPGPIFFLGHSHGGLVLAQALLEPSILQAQAPCIFSAPYFGNSVPIPWFIRIFARIGNVVFPALKIPSHLEPAWLTTDPKMQEEDRLDPLRLKSGTPRWLESTFKQQKETLLRAQEIANPLLMMGGDEDQLADLTTSQRFFKRCRSPDKHFQVYKGMKHELFRDENRERVFQDLFDWIQARLTPSVSGKSKIRSFANNQRLDSLRGASSIDGP